MNDYAAICDHKGCQNNVTHDKAVWHTKDHMEVKYYCPEHAPADAEPIEEDVNHAD